MGAEPLPLIETTTGDLSWLVAPQYRELLLGPDGLRLDEWLQNGQAKVVKRRRHRVIYRVELPGLCFHLKHNRIADLRGWLREWVRPSKARLEYQRTLAIAARSVPTVLPIALGERAGGIGPGDSFLITQTIEGAGPLDVFIEHTLSAVPPERHARLRQRLAIELGEFMARLHDAGVVHHDLHCGNLLIRLDDDWPRLFLIDPHAVRIGPALGWSASRANLAILNRWLAVRTSRTDRLRFWNAYCSSRRARAVSRHIARGRLPRRSAAELAREVEQKAWQDSLCFWRRRDRRCCETNRYFRRVRSRAAIGHAVSDLDAAALAPLLADPDAPFRQPEAVILRNSRTSTVIECTLVINGEPRRLIYKRFRVRNWREPWANLLRWPPALRSWVYGHGLRERSLPTSRPLAVLHRRRRGLWWEGYILMEEVPDALDLRRFLAVLGQLPPDEGCTALRGCIGRVAKLVRELHARGLSHRDLKAGNILASGEPGPAGPAGGLWLVDLVGVQRHRWLPHERKLQNLARLHASFCQDPLLTRTDKLRFLRTYLQWGLHGREDWKHWWRAIEAGTQAKVARNARVGRPLN